MKNHRFDITEGKTLKILDLFTTYIEIKNEKENGKIIIDLSSIIEIIPVEGTVKDISMKYNSNGTEKVTRFSCDERGNLLSRVITMKDRSSKFISDYSIETFKCYNLFILNSQILKDIGQKLSENMKGKSKSKPINTSNPLNKYIAFCTLYRTYSVVNQLNSKELKTYYVKLEKIIRIQVAPNIYGLILEDFNKIRIAIIPINQKDVLVIKNLIISYAKKYLNFEIKYEEINDYLKDNSTIDLSLSKSKSNYLQNEKKPSMLNQISASQNNNINLKTRHSEIPDDLNFRQKKLLGKNLDANKENKLQNYLFVYKDAYRIIYNENKQKIILKLTYENIEYMDYYPSENENTIINFSDIFIVAVKGEEDEYFEIITKTKSRFIFEIKEKILFLNDLIELLLKYYKTKKITEQFLIFSYKIGIEKNMRPIEDLSNRYIIEMRKSEQIMYEKEENFMDIIEDIVVNRFFVEGNSSKLLLTDKISKILIQKFDYYYEKCINEKKDIKNNIILLNLLLILFKNLGMSLILNEFGKKICENIFIKLTKELEDRNFNNKRENNIILNDYALFYNAIHVIEYFSLYKQIMLLKVISFNNYENKEINIFNYNSMYLNFLIIFFEHKLVEFKEIPDMFLPQSEYFYILLTFYKILIYEPFFAVRNAILLLSTLIEKIIPKNQREFKEILLKKTMIFYALIRIYFINNNHDIILSRNCLKLFQTLLLQYYEMSIPIKNIFPPTLIKTIGGKKDPDKWEKIECEKFFIDILKDYYEEKIIWNIECKTELIDALNKLIEEYEINVKNKLIEINPSHNETRKNYYKDLINIIFNIEKYDDLYLYPKKSIEYKPLFCIDYLNFKVDYNILKKEVYVLDTYINILIKNNLKEINIDRPAKYWKKLKKEIVISNDAKRLVIISAMKLIYQKYFGIIGNFDWYNMMNKIYKSTKSKKLQEQIKQLFYISIRISDDEIKENNIRDLMQENINYININ